MFDYICSFIRSVLDQWGAGDIADYVTARHIRHELLITHGDTSWLDYFCGVNDDTGLGRNGAGDLAGSIFHALLACDRNRDVVDHRQDVVRACLNTGLTANAPFGNYDWMRVLRPGRIVFFQ